MRMRTKKHGVERMEAVSNQFAVLHEKKFDTEQMQSDKASVQGYVTDCDRIDLQKTFSHIENSDNMPLFLEIGCGKGSFISALSLRYPNARLLAFEKIHDVLLLAMEREKGDNVRFLLCDVTNIDTLLPEHSVDRLYINFCDPWPRKKNAKRRLTAPSFLQKYKRILSENAVIYFKTDNRPLFDYSIEQFEANGYELNNVIFDLHASELDSVNIRTEYENNFSEKGFKINYLEAKMK